MVVKDAVDQDWPVDDLRHGVYSRGLHFQQALVLLGRGTTLRTSDLLRLKEGAFSEVLINHVGSFSFRYNLVN